MKHNHIFAALAGSIAVCTALTGCASAAPDVNAEQTAAAAATITLNGGSASVQGKGAAVKAPSSQFRMQEPTVLQARLTTGRS